MGKRRKGSRMETTTTANDAGYSYGEASESASQAGTTKRERRALGKITKKQKIRLAKKRDRGEAFADRTTTKGNNDARKLELRMRAKALW